MLFTIDIEKKDVFVHCYTGNGRNVQLMLIFQSLNLDLIKIMILKLLEKKEIKDLKKKFKLIFVKNYIFMLKMFFTFKKISDNVSFGQNEEKLIN